MKDEKEAKKVGLGKNIAMKRKDIVKRWNCLYYKMNLRWGNNVYKDEIKRQEESNQLKIDYMKKLKNGR